MNGETVSLMAYQEMEERYKALVEVIEKIDASKPRVLRLTIDESNVAMSDENKRLKKLNAELVAALKEVEWIPTENESACPCCDSPARTQKHKTSCKIAEAIKHAEEMNG